jgi:GT2 family glycosyltransferase
VTVTLNGLPWIEQCLESLAGVETILVDHGSTDGTVPRVRERFPDVRVVEQENRGLGAGLNVGMRAEPAGYHLLINSDAWLLGDALARLVAFADAHEDAAVVAPRLRNPDGTLQRPCGASRRSTSSCAGWRRARTCSTPTTPATSTTPRPGRSTG